MATVRKNKPTVIKGMYMGARNDRYLKLSKPSAVDSPKAINTIIEYIQHMKELKSSIP